MGEGEFTLKSTKIVNAVVGTVLVEANVNRVGLLFAVAAGAANLSVAAVGVPGTNPVISVPSTGNLQILYKDWGPLPSYQWVASSAPALIDIYVVELLLVLRG